MTKFRVLFISAFAVCLFSCFAFSGSAVTYDDVTNGPLYDRIIFWQDYVTESVVAEDSDSGLNGWVTSVELPSDSRWKLGSQGVVLADKYTTTSDVSLSGITSQYNLLSWETPYYISLEDLQVRTNSRIDFGFQSNHVISDVVLYVEVYDSYKNLLSSSGVFQSDVNSNTFQDHTFWVFSKLNFDAGAKYVKFIMDFTYVPNSSTDRFILRDFHWRISLPYEFDPSVYKVDGIDAWMNGYFKPTVPDGGQWQGYEESLVQTGQDSLAELLDMKNSIIQILRNNNFGTQVWLYVFRQFFAMNWLYSIIAVSAFVGILAVLFDLRNDIAPAVRSFRNRGQRNKGSSNGKIKRN